jgi:hypothetical protein
MERVVINFVDLLVATGLTAFYVVAGFEAEYAVGFGLAFLILRRTSPMD